VNIAFRKIGIVLLPALIAAACTTVGPDYVEPTSTIQAGWIEYDDPALSSQPPLEPKWWSDAYGDPVLDQLVEASLEQNLSLRSAGLRVLQAQQQLAIAIGSQYPQQQALSGEAELFDVGGGSEQMYSLGFNLSWEADVWGKFTRQIQSASAALDASVASYDGVMLSLISQVAQNYLLIRTTQQQLLAAQYNLDLQRQSVVITTAKYDAGETSALDVEQALSLMHNTEASLAGLEITLQQLKNSLSVLLGKPPQQMVDLLTDPKPVPTVKPQVALGMPQDLIRRRPDLRTAERQLAAQSAQIGVAAAELYPSFGIGGSVGTSVSTAEGENFDDLFSSGTNAASLFGFFNWNIFNYGRLKSNVRLQDAVFQQLLTDYRESVLEAQAEVENSIVAYLKSQQQLTAFQSAADAAQRAADISTLQYRDGEVDFNTVISTLRSLASQQEQLAAIQGTVATNLVEVYKSLGGGWQIRQGQDSLDLIPVETRDEMLERTKAWQKVFKQNG
jgi:NodT family efflux transporter outer membrane factor (OMF) lipoprotein